MLDAIPSTAAPRATSPAKAGQKPGDAPDEPRFQQVYGKGEKAPGDRKEAVAAESPAAETPAPQAAPAVEVADAASQGPVAAPPVAPAEGQAIEQPDSDEPTEVVTVSPDAPPETETVAGTVPAQPAELPESVPAPVAAEIPRGSSAPTVEPPAAQSGATQTRAVSQDDGVVPMTAAQSTEPFETAASGRDVEARARPSAASSTEAAELPAAPRAEPAAAPTPRAAEMPTVPPAAADSAPVSGLHAASPAPAPQPLQAAAPVAPPPAAVIEQLVVAAKQNSDGRVDLTLSPAELGRVRMTLLAGETGITVAIHADRDDTLDLFRRNSDTLAQEFRQMGYGSVGFEFRGGGQSGRPAREAIDDAGEIIAPETPTPLPLGILRLTGIGGLDIRL